MENAVWAAAVLITGAFGGAFMIFGWPRSGRRGWLFGAATLLAFDALVLSIS